MNCKLYVIGNHPKNYWFVVNNEKVYRYISSTVIRECPYHFRDSVFYDEYKPFAEFSNKRDLLDVIYYLAGNKNTKRYKRILANEKLYEYFI